MKNIIKWVVKSGKTSESYGTRDIARSAKRNLKNEGKDATIERQEYSLVSSKFIR